MTVFGQHNSDESALRSLDPRKNGADSIPHDSNATATTLNDGAGREQAPELTCAAVATGMKCLPASKVAQAKGNVLHDWHAEVLAIRGFNRWILEECALLAQQGRGGTGEWVDWSDEDEEVETSQDTEGDLHATNSRSLRPPFRLKPDVQIHMFCSQAPCGDASMELTMASQQDATPWTSAAPSANPDDMLGRGHFDRLGVVRRKPARPDAPVTMSKSCSDKLALKQVTGLLNSTSAKLVQARECYLQTFVMPEMETVREAVDRAFGRNGRLMALNAWHGSRGGYQFRPFEVRATARTFAFCAQGAEAGGSNLSALWTPRKQEIMVNGVLLGRKQSDPRGASCVSRRKIWKLALDIAVTAGIPAVANSLRRPNYEEIKDGGFDGRREAKEAAWKLSLHGWKRNERDSAWALED